MPSWRRLPTLVLASVYPVNSADFNVFDVDGQPYKEFCRSELFATQGKADQWVAAFAKHSQWRSPKFTTVPGYCSGCCNDDGEWFHILGPGEPVGIVFETKESGGEETVRLHCDGALWNLAEWEAPFKMPRIHPHRHYAYWKGPRLTSEICEAGEKCQNSYRVGDIYSLPGFEATASLAMIGKSNALEETPF